MPRTDQPFIQIPWSFDEHEKTEALSDGAYRAFVSMVIFCARNRTDGRITAAQAQRRWKPKVIRELLAAPFLYETDGGYLLHEFGEHQMTTADLDALHAKRAAAGAAGGRAKAERRAANNGLSPAQTPAAASSNGLASASALAGKPVAEKEEEQEQEQPQLLELPSSPPAASTRGRARPSVEESFTAFYLAYPRKVAKDHARRMFAQAVRRAPADRIVAAAVAYAADPNLPADRTKIPHPGTWLHDGRWDDEPCPAPGSPPGAARGRVRAIADEIVTTLDVGRQMDAEAAAASTPVPTDLSRRRLA